MVDKMFMIDLKRTLDPYFIGDGNKEWKMSVSGPVSAREDLSSQWSYATMAIDTARFPADLVSFLARGRGMLLRQMIVAAHLARTCSKNICHSKTEQTRNRHRYCCFHNEIAITLSRHGRLRRHVGCCFSEAAKWVFRLSEHSAAERLRAKRKRGFS
jgi:hypothetical protein